MTDSQTSQQQQQLQPHGRQEVADDRSARGRKRRLQDGGDPGGNIDIDINDPNNNRLGVEQREPENGSAEQQPQTPTCELVALLPFRYSDFSATSYESALAMELAVRHLNDGDGSLVPELRTLRETCPIVFSATYTDTRRNSSHAFAIVDALTRRKEVPPPTTAPATATNATDNTVQPPPPPSRKAPLPCAFLGEIDSRISQATALLTGLRGVPQISMGSTSGRLNDPIDYPLFGRTIPDDGVAAELLIRFLHDEMNIRNIFVIFESHPYTRSITTRLRDAIRVSGWAPGHKQRGDDDGEAMHMSSQIYETRENDGTTLEDELGDAVLALKTSKYRFVIALVTSAEAGNRLLEIAVGEGVAGNGDHHWFFFETIDESLPTAVYPADSALAKAYDGVGVIAQSVDRTGNVYERFERQSLDLKRELYAVDENENETKNDTGWDEWLSGSRNESSWFHNGTYDSSWAPGFTYDATVLLGMSACLELAENGGSGGGGGGEPHRYHLTGTDLYRRAVQTNFTGISGNVVLDHETGSRDGRSVRYAIKNWVTRPSPSENGDDEMVGFESTVTHLYTPGVMGGGDVEDWEVVGTYLFKGGKTREQLRDQPDLPPVNMTFNQANKGVQMLAFILAVSITVGTVGFSAWTCRNSSSRIVRASQPFFLHLLCLGVAILGLSIVPIGFEHFGETVNNNAICNGFVGMFMIGYGVTFSTLFAKTYRINRIIRSSKRCKRVTLTVRDTLLPVVIMLAYNVILLSLMMVYGPAEHKKNLGGEDVFGRNTEISTRCSYHQSLPYLIPLILGNMGMIGLASFQAWKARHLSTEFAESGHIASALLVSFVAVIMAVPVWFLTDEFNPTLDTFVQTIVVFILASNVLLFIFVPKVRMLHDKSKSSSRPKPTATMFRTGTTTATTSSSSPPTTSGGSSDMSGGWLTNSSGSTHSSVAGDRILTLKPSAELAAENRSLQREVSLAAERERDLRRKNETLRNLLRDLTNNNNNNNNNKGTTTTITDEELDALVGPSTTAKKTSTIRWDGQPNGSKMDEEEDNDDAADGGSFIADAAIGDAVPTVDGVEEDEEVHSDSSYCFGGDNDDDESKEEEEASKTSIGESR